MGTELAALTETEFRDYGVRKNIIRTELEQIGTATTRIGEELEYIREHKLYRQEYGTFAGFVQTEYGKTAQWAYAQLEHIQVLTNLQNVKSTLQNPSPSISHELASLPDEEQADAYAEATEKAEAKGKERPTTKDVKETVKARRNAKGGEYKPPETPKQTVPVGPNLKEFDRLLGAAIRHYDACATHYKWTAKVEHEDLLEAAGTVSEKYAELVEGME